MNSKTKIYKSMKKSNKTTKGKKEKMKKSIFYYALPALFVGVVALSVVSCADDNLIPNGGLGDKDAVVSFSVNDVQDNAIANGIPVTRSGIITPGFITPGIMKADLVGHKLEATNTSGLDVCLIETTIEGVNPIKADARTRADIKTGIDGDFSSTGIRGDAVTNILTTPEWFHAVKTKNNGQLYSPIYWDWPKPHARFFAVYPEASTYPKMTINNTTVSGSPSVDFEVEPNVEDQKDFMTACTGNVHYATHGVHPTTNLDFRHALTAIRFAVGQNLSWNKIIDKVEIRNAVMKSKYTLSSQFNGTGAAWDHSADTRSTATLSGVSVSTSQSPNVTIMGNAGDNFTFYMIPQVLTGNNVHAYIHCTDGTVIDVELKGEWKAGTTRTYKLSQTNSTWAYTLTTTNPNRHALHDEKHPLKYGVTSYRQAPDGTQQAVPWKVIGYDTNNDGTFSMSEKPTWLASISKTEGQGSIYSESGDATVSSGGLYDFLKVRNDGLKNATPRGSAGAYYDLSLHDYQGNPTTRNTANSYLISAPGFYRIPLVYGNAIKNGNDNPDAYRNSLTGDALTNFIDHNGADITSPWIEKTNGNAYAGIDDAKLVWADVHNLVHFSSSKIVHEGGNAFLQFEVKAADIASGNAVVAVTKGGDVVWSWHLWFAPQTALDKVKVTTPQNDSYYFTSETLGFRPTVWMRTPYSQPRSVKIRVEQTIGNNGIKQVSDITIVQEPGRNVKSYPTHYQWGRKDPFPGTDFPGDGPAIGNNAVDGSWTGGFNSAQDYSNNQFIQTGIQEPNKFLYISGNIFHTIRNDFQYNLWGAINTNGDPNIKTIYDPCPVGFKVPSNAKVVRSIFSNGASTVGGVSGLRDYWANSSKTSIISTATPRWISEESSGSLYGIQDVPHWTAQRDSSPYDAKTAEDNSEETVDCARGYAIRPVSE